MDDGQGSGDGSNEANYDHGSDDRNADFDEDVDMDDKWMKTLQYEIETNKRVWLYIEPNLKV